MEARNVGLLVAAVVVLGFAEGSAQARGAGAFQPLLADPKEPQFFATYLWDRSPRLGSRLASVGFGQTIGLVRESDWELAIAAGVFSQFNMQSATNDLINTDYLVGLPLTYRHGSWSTRLRLRSEEHTSELQSPCNLVCRLLLEKKKKKDSAYNVPQSTKPTRKHVRTTA